jgi:hypothetical protein
MQEDLPNHATDSDSILDIERREAQEENGYSVLDAKTKRDARPFWQRWREDILEDRLDDLNLGIELYPQNPTNYVLRGELFLEQHQEELARSDFETALQLANEQVISDRWGLVAQSVQDRAIMGLRRVNSSE